MTSTTRRSVLGLFITASAIPLASRFSIAAAPLAAVGNAGYYRFQFGQYEITALSDGTLALPMARIYQGEPEGELQRRLDENFLGPEPHASINAYLVNDGARLVLIDAGTGTFFGPSAGKLIAHLHNSGYDASQVDDIILTHIHTDHSGGLTIDGVAQFPNATLHVSEQELRYWIAEPVPADASDALKKWRQEAAESLAPYIAAGRVRTFEKGVDPISGFGSIARFGHTPGHSAIVLKSEGQKMVFWGDTVHGDYVQFDEPDISVSFDVDSNAAIGSRERALSEAAAEGYLVAGAHLPFPGVGRVARDETLYRFVPKNYVG